MVERRGPCWRLLIPGLVVALLAASLAGCAAPEPAFEVTALEVAADGEIYTGDEVEVTARVANTGTGAGTYEAELTVDGAPQGDRQVSIEPGEAATVRFTVTAGPAGVHEVTLGPATAALTVTAIPDFQLRGLRLAAAPTEILAGDRLEYQLDVVNEGDAAGTYAAQLTVDGVVRARQDVTLEPGGATTVPLPIEAGAPGQHLVAVGDRQATFTVLAPAAVAVTDLVVTPNPATAKDDLAAAVTVTNTGGAGGALTVSVRVDGKVRATQEVTVAGGERRTVELALAVPAPGRHTVGVGDLEKRLLVWKITRPSNGTVLTNKVKGGYGRLTVKNGDPDRDCVLVLAAKAKPSKAVLAVYVRAKKSATVKGIKDGTYVAYFTHGAQWDAITRSFTQDAERRRFADPIRFKTQRTSTGIVYDVWTLSLHQLSGNAPTDPVDDADFPSVP
jgi:archaellum component FlaG (FlaF/FlaG flagellin family)